MDNETRARIKEAQDQAAKEWNAAFDYISIRNGVSVGNIKMLHLDGVNTRALEIIAEHSRITELLKEERIKAIDECIDSVLDKSTEADRFIKFSYQEIKKLLEALKGKLQ